MRVPVAILFLLVYVQFQITSCPENWIYRFHSHCNNEYGIGDVFTSYALIFKEWFHSFRDLSPWSLLLFCHLQPPITRCPSHTYGFPKNHSLPNLHTRLKPNTDCSFPKDKAFTIAKGDEGETSPTCNCQHSFLL